MFSNLALDKNNQRSARALKKEIMPLLNYLKGAL